LASISCSGLPAERKSGKESPGSKPSFAAIAQCLLLMSLSTLAIIEDRVIVSR
jgi:hypothetical protein